VCSSDLGSCIVKSFVQQGCRTIVADVDLEQAQKVAAAFPAAQVQACQIDITSEQSVIAAVTAAVEKFGRIDVLVNVAGILCRKSFFQTTKEDFDKSFAINVTGMFLVSQAVAETMKKQNGGTIVNISSMNSKLAVENRVVYGTTKAAVNLLTQSMAIELAPYNITVNAVAPGVVDSKMARVRLNTSELVQEYAKSIPLNRMASLQDVANCVLFLSSPGASYISGDIVVVDGALTARMSLPRP
jgi:NAD(P)-dependent dehydrogenase (short-subunit alcohol dehydrogenase family)